MPALLQDQGNYRHNDGRSIEQDCEPFEQVHSQASLMDLAGCGRESIPLKTLTYPNSQ
jgi:hypothetical protein